MVQIYTRDVNGKHGCWQVNWDAGSSDFYQIAETSSEEEILFITYNGACVYSQLGHEPITWEDVIGFFA